MDSKTTLGWRVINWIGIIDQLARAKGERTLKPLGLTTTEFSVLNHIVAREAEAKTVTAIAAAMQMLQPNVTKIVAKLVKRRVLKLALNAKDGRSKLITLTVEGRALHAKAISAFAPLIGETLAGWDVSEVEVLFAHLDRLKTWLDENR